MQFYNIDVCVDPQGRLSMPTALMTQVNDTLVHMFNSPALRSIAMHNCE